jgi:hypothetical protein
MFLYIALIEVFPDLSTIIDHGALDGERSAMVTDPSRFQVSFQLSERLLLLTRIKKNRFEASNLISP